MGNTYQPPTKCEVLFRLWAHNDEQYRESDFRELPVWSETQAVKEKVAKKKKKKEEEEEKKRVVITVQRG